MLRQRWGMGTYLVNLMHDLVAQVCHPPVGGRSLAGIILASNSPVVRRYPLLSSTGPINAEIHQISAPTAGLIALHVRAAADTLRGSFPLVFPTVTDSVAYVLACLAQESRFDPACYNHNLSAIYPTPSFARTDVGIGQLNGASMPTQPDLVGLSPDQQIRKVMDPAWAIPTFTRMMAGHVSFAAKAASAYVPPAYGARVQWIATLAYNRGEHGAADILAGKKPAVPHPDRVMAKKAKFQSDLYAIGYA